MATTATFVPNLTNAVAEVSAIGKVTKDGVRFSAGTEGRQSVLNVKMAFRRSWQDQNSKEWKDKTSYLQFALWGERAEKLHAKLLEIGTAQMDIRIKVTFSLADVEARIWGEQKDRTEMNIRANSLEIIGAYPFTHGTPAVSENTGDDVAL